MFIYERNFPNSEGLFFILLPHIFEENYTSINTFPFNFSGGNFKFDLIYIHADKIHTYCDKTRAASSSRDVTNAKIN